MRAFLRGCIIGAAIGIGAAFTDIYVVQIVAAIALPAINEIFLVD